MMRRLLGTVWLGIAAVTLVSIRAAAQDAMGGEPAMAAHAHTATPAQRDPERDALISRARVGSAQFLDRNAAIAAGYRQVGMNFPSMGEHWISPRLVIEAQFDVARPAILTYITVNGSPVLTGVVYAVPLAQGDSPPSAFGPNAMWHEHSGTVDEESMHPIHDGSVTSAAGTRLAILHVWTGVPNPAGLFAAENWALPFIRLGLPAPADFPIGASRALSLLSGGSRYYLEVAGSDGGDVNALDAALSDCAITASQIVAQAHATSRTLMGDDLRRLDEAWTTAMRRVEKLSGMETVRKMNGGLLPYAISLAPPSPAAPSPSLQPSAPAHYMVYRLLSSTPLHRF